MLSTLQLIQAYTLREPSQRIEALRKEAAMRPDGAASYVLAVVLWEEGELDEANEMATALLKESPTDFNLLVICLDHRIRANDSSGTLEYARRVAAVRKPSALRRAASVLARPRSWPARLLGFGEASANVTEAMDEWAEWAHEYVERHSNARSVDR